VFSLFHYRARIMSHQHYSFQNNISVGFKKKTLNRQKRWRKREAKVHRTLTMEEGLSDKVWCDWYYRHFVSARDGFGGATAPHYPPSPPQQDKHIAHHPLPSKQQYLFKLNCSKDLPNNHSKIDFPLRKKTNKED